MQVEQETFDVGLATNYLVIQYQTLSGAGAVHRSGGKGRVREGEAGSGSSHGAYAGSKSGIDSGGGERACVAEIGGAAVS